MNIEVIIPAYNCRKTLSTTLGSLVSQTIKDFSVHIIDDCSTEDFSDIISHFEKFLNIKITRNSRNLGCGITRQVGIDSSTADYIAFLDSDDTLMPYTIEVWKNMAEANKDIDVFHSYFYAHDNSTLTLKKEGFTWCHGKLYKLNFIRKWNIRNDARVKYADDSFFNSMCFELGKFATIPIAMYCWLNNKESITRSGNIAAKDSIKDFKTAMELSIHFLRENGVEKINHISKTIGLFEEMKSQTNNEIIIKEIDKLIEFLKDNIN